MMGMPLVAAAELYRYDDENGKRHIANNLNDVPPQFREAAIADLKARGDGETLSILEGTDAKVPTPPATAPNATNGSETGLIGGHDQDWWQAQMLERQAQVDDLQGQVDALKEGPTKFSAEIAGKPRPEGGPEREMAQDDKFATQDGPSLGKLESQLAEAESALEQFKEQARQMSVPPGWLR
jgi:hypothetical protein